jgi:hypothetical protein
MDSSRQFEVIYCLFKFIAHFSGYSFLEVKGFLGVREIVMNLSDRESLVRSPDE